MGECVPFPRRVLEADSVDVAPALLNGVIVAGGCAGRIVEVEAYRGEEDPASHAYRGPTARNATMFGRAGLLYVYFTYGMHWCANIVCGPEDRARAVLVRALAPLAGTEIMRSRRPAARRDSQLCSGPARLCQALAISGEHDGVDLLDPDSPVRLLTDGTAPPAAPAQGPRVGITAAAEHPWRWWVPDDPNVSPARPRSA